MTGITDYKMLIGGAWVDAADQARFDSVNPSTGDAWATIPEATAGDVDTAVQAAHAALDGPWGEITATARGKVLGRLADLLAENSEHIGRVETTDTGKMFTETAWQATYIAEFLHF